MMIMIIYNMLKLKKKQIKNKPRKKKTKGIMQYINDN